MIDSIKPLAYYATLEHAQWILGTDGQYLHQIGKCKDVQAASRMLRDYNVARTIWGKGGLPVLVQEVFDKLKSESWPDDLMDRARWCASAAKSNAEQSSVTSKRTQGAPYSAVTKLCWFLRPSGWTMYDQFACLGLTGSKGANACERFESFYDALHETGFTEKAACANQIVKDRFECNIFFAERIIDKFLMIRGKIWSQKNLDVGMKVRKQLTCNNQLFLDNLLRISGASDTSIGKRIDQLATKISEILPNDSFKTDYVEEQLKRIPI